MSSRYRDIGTSLVRGRVGVQAYFAALMQLKLKVYLSITNDRLMPLIIQIYVYDILYT